MNQTQRMQDNGDYPCYTCKKRWCDEDKCPKWRNAFVKSWDETRNVLWKLIGSVDAS